jgi:hypothetical protein
MPPIKRLQAFVYSQWLYYPLIRNKKKLNPVTKFYKFLTYLPGADIEF